MYKSKRVFVLSSLSALTFAVVLSGQRTEAPQQDAEQEQFGVAHPECDFFGPQRDRFLTDAALLRGARPRNPRSLSTITNQVSRMLATVPGGSRTHTVDQEQAAGSLDSYIFADFQKNGIKPAARTNDWEFIRRLTLDLTGHIPTPDRVLAFAADNSYAKREKLIDELLAKPEWVDKWTMYFGDLYHSTDSRPSTGLRRYPEGRNAFYKYIHDSLAANKPYNQMATEMIGVSAANSYEDGASNFLLNGYMGGGPAQDIMDLTAASVFETFLGMTHVNCVLCHNGRGHLDNLNLWATGVTRYQAWELAGFFSHTPLTRVPVTPGTGNPYYWSVADNLRATDYALNTTTGNRPARVAPSGCKSGQPCFYVPPQYVFTGESPKPGEAYRVALARYITSDFQFARATVNYMWAYFFGRGIVDPPETFDPARLDPNHPPPAPWTLQPSNPALLQALAEHFVASGYNLKVLMKEITSSDTYQLSSRYDGAWNIAWEPYFARKFVRRLWGEEIHDAVAQSSGTSPNYNYANFTTLGFPTFHSALQIPDVVNGLSDVTGTSGNAGNVQPLLDAFIRGNRDDQPRKYEGSILQALNLMNNNFVVQRTHATGTNASQLVARNLTMGNTDLINTLFLNIVSRFPTPEELAKAQAAIPASGNTRTQAVSDLVWVLYNKVDFVFNY